MRVSVRGALDLLLPGAPSTALLGGKAMARGCAWLRMTGCRHSMSVPQPKPCKVRTKGEEQREQGTEL